MAPYQRQAMVNAIMGKRGGGRPASVGGLNPPMDTNWMGGNAARGPWQGGGGDFHNTNVPNIPGNGPWTGGGGDFIDTRVPGDMQPRTGGPDPNPYYNRPMDPPGLDPNINYKPMDPVKTMNPPGLNPGNEQLDAAIATQNLFNTMQPGYMPRGGITPLPGGETPQTPGYNGWSKSPGKIGTTIDFGGGGGAVWNSMGDFGPGGNVVNNVMPPALPLSQPNAQKGMLGLGSALNKNFLARPGGGR